MALRTGLTEDSDGGARPLAAFPVYGEGRAIYVVISPGARLRFSEFSQHVKTTVLRIEGHLEVELLKLRGEVVVGKTGVLVGNVEVGRFQVEKGGSFEGKLSVG